MSDQASEEVAVKVFGTSQDVQSLACVKFAVDSVCKYTKLKIDENLV